MDIFGGINFLILLILALATLRDIIIYFVPLPRSGKVYKFLMESKYDKYLLESTLNEMGYDSEAVITKIKKSKAISYNRNSRYLDKLISLISGHITNTENVKYGDSRESCYYINTMDAIQYKDDGETMIDLMEELIQDYHRNKESGNFNIDFIITPKDGNCILGYNYGKKRNRIVLLAKSRNDKSYGNYNEGEYEKSFFTNFEGANSLIKLAQEKGRSLNGIVLDCNCSSGAQLLNTMDYFNNIAQNNEFKQFITPVVEAFVLFRVDNKATDIDAKFEEKGYNLHRYFDLNEDIKKIIYDCKTGDRKLANGLREYLEGYEDKIDLYQSCGKECIQKIKNELQERNLLKYDIN